MAFSLLSVGARAMSANYAALQTTSNNIANASVEGYSRQQANLRTTAGQPLGSGFVGSGVTVGSITRAHDAFLTREAATANSQASFDSTRLGLLSQLESAFATGDSGVGAAASNFFSALSDLAGAPGDTAARQSVLSRAGELAQRFSSAGQHLESLQSGVVAELRTSVDSINGLTGNLAQLNDEIVRQQALGQPSSELLDRRDQLVHQLSGFLQVTTLASDDGALSVFAAGGQSLVLGGKAQKLEVAGDRLDPSRATVALREADGSVRRLDSALLEGGGSVGALLRFQNDDLVAARNALGQMALALAARTNQQQALGLDLGNPPAAGAPMFTDFVAQSLDGKLKALPAQGNTLTNVEIHITDASLLEAEEYTLEAQPGGTWLMTRGSDGEQFSSADGGATFKRASGDDFHPGFTLQLGGAPAPGDRFLLQPVGQAAARIERVLIDPKGVAAAAPATATTPGTSNGNAKALAALASEALVGRSWSASGTSGGSTFVNAYASALSGVGTRVQSAQMASDISSSVATDALVRRDAQSGVDLDEEGAKLLAFQKSYQAAAKVLQVAQSVFDTLLEATSGR
ncbi:flagellar hook-associated protein FlgK [uncultured Azohydromonas sp.]|jgi:flagellar hook-associated protein FlgK|uniref:flagellar hook-associated protein FlgK n=1 Tax=uncultured Azohydromonas sp. TaxID=487342 RepID=UPI0026299294|nr:flagellar hook-associated protein FlgK [uncultured Azohydromonas sp.]